MKTWLIIIGLVCFSLGAAIVVLAQINSHQKAVAQNYSAEQELILAEALLNAEELLRAETIRANEAERAKIFAEIEIQKLRLLSEGRENNALEPTEVQSERSAEQAKTYPARLAAAESEVERAKQHHSERLEEVEKLRISVAIAQAKTKTVEQKALALERQEKTARTSKDRLEGQYRSAYYDSGARERASREEREQAIRLIRGTTTKVGEAWALAVREKIKLELLEIELSEAKSGMQIAGSALTTAMVNLDKIKNEKSLPQSTPQKRTEPDITWVYINDSGEGMKDIKGVLIERNGFTGFMSKYLTTTAQYAQYLNAALASGDITVNGNYVRGASGPYSGIDYYHLNRPGETVDGAKNGGRSRIRYLNGSFIFNSEVGKHPVTFVSWHGASAFANYYGWRLPTEWEWQAVADFDGSYNYGCGPEINNKIANYIGSHHPAGTTPVGAFGTYGYGMCDMAGNVREWTSTSESNSYVLRGGGWRNTDDFCSVTHRESKVPPNMTHNCGFRVCR